MDGFDTSHTTTRRKTRWRRKATSRSCRQSMVRREEVTKRAGRVPCHRMCRAHRDRAWTLCETGRVDELCKETLLCGRAAETAEPCESVAHGTKHCLTGHVRLTPRRRQTSGGVPSLRGLPLFAVSHSSRPPSRPYSRRVCPRNSHE